MGVEFRDVRQRLHNVGGVVHDDNRPRTGHAAGLLERIEIVGNVQHVNLGHRHLAVLPFAPHLELLARFEDFGR